MGLEKKKLRCRSCWPAHSLSIPKNYRSVSKIRLKARQARFVKPETSLKAIRLLYACYGRQWNKPPRMMAGPTLAMLENISPTTALSRRSTTATKSGGRWFGKSDYSISKCATRILLCMFGMRARSLKLRLASKTAKRVTDEFAQNLLQGSRCPLSLKSGPERIGLSQR